MIDTHAETISFAEEFRPHIDAAVLRLSYLHPEVKVRSEDGVVITAHALAELTDAVRDFQFILYREKIYTETRNLRRTLIQGIMSR